MYTAQEIYDMSITIIDELSGSGTVDPNATKEYRYKAPQLLDMFQKELADKGGLYAVEEYKATELNEIMVWTLHDLPANIRRIREVLFVPNSNEHLRSIQYRKFGDEIYLYFDMPGTARLLYVPIPEKVDTISDVLEIDDTTATLMAYMLAEQFALSDMNTDLANQCKQKYEQLKAAMRERDVVGYVGIEDVYC